MENQKKHNQKKMNDQLIKIIQDFIEWSGTQGEINKILKARLEDLAEDILYFNNKKL